MYIYIICICVVIHWHVYANICFRNGPCACSGSKHFCIHILQSFPFEFFSTCMDTHIYILSQQFHALHLLCTVIRCKLRKLRFGFGQDAGSTLHYILHEQKMYSWYWLWIASLQEYTLQECSTLQVSSYTLSKRK